MKTYTHSTNSLFLFKDKSTLKTDGALPETIEPIDDPIESMKSIEANSEQNALFELTGKFTSQICFESEAISGTDSKTLYAVATFRGDKPPRERSVFKLFSNHEAAFNLKRHLNLKFYSAEVYSFECAISNKFSSMKELAVEWDTAI